MGIEGVSGLGVDLVVDLGVGLAVDLVVGLGCGLGARWVVMYRRVGSAQFLQTQSR